MKLDVSKHMTNERMLKTLKSLRKAGRIVPPFLSSRIVKEHYEENKEAFRRHREKVEADGGFIENQDEFRDMNYGVTSVYYAGCQVIAVYNILYALTGKTPNLSKLIAAFEKNGMIFYGRLGTDPGKTKSFLEKRGFAVDEYTDPSAYLMREAAVTGPVSNMRKASKRRSLPTDEAFILTYYNNRIDIMRGLHTAAVTSDGRWFFLHNYGGTRAKGPYADMEGLIGDLERNGAGVISFMHIRSRSRD